MRYWHDTTIGQYHAVYDTPSEISQYVIGRHYLVDGYVYPFLGRFTAASQVTKYYECGIALIDDGKERYELIHGFWKNPSENKIRCSETNLTDGDYSEELTNPNLDPEFIAGQYVDAWNAGRNLAIHIKDNAPSTGDIYIPKTREEDSPLERILKMIITSMKVVSSEQRKRVSDDYKYDNMVSSLDGATKHLSIIKFLEWTRLLEIEWEFSVFDMDGAPYPLGKTLTVSNRDDAWADIEVPEDKELFMVPCVEGEDPFKRLIKLALWTKQVPKSVYRKKGSTPHQINNLISALRSTQKMTSDYFAIWCELLSMGSSFTLTNQKGIWYKAVGYDITTNYKEEDNDNSST